MSNPSEFPDRTPASKIRSCGDAPRTVVVNNTPESGQSPHFIPQTRSLFRASHEPPQTIIVNNTPDAKRSPILNPEAQCPVSRSYEPPQTIIVNNTPDAKRSPILNPEAQRPVSRSYEPPQTIIVNNTPDTSRSQRPSHPILDTPAPISTERTAFSEPEVNCEPDAPETDVQDSTFILSSSSCTKTEVNIPENDVNYPLIDSEQPRIDLQNLSYQRTEQAIRSQIITADSAQQGLRQDLHDDVVINTESEKHSNPEHRLGNSTQDPKPVIHRSSNQHVQQHQPSHYHKTEVVVPLAQESLPDPLVSSSNRPDSVPIPEDIAFFAVASDGLTSCFVTPQGFYEAFELEQFGKTLFFTVFESLLPFKYNINKERKPTTSFSNNCESSFHVHFSSTATSSHVIKALIDLLTHFSSIPIDQLTIVVDQFIKRVDNSEPFSLAEETPVIALLRPFPLALSTLKTRRPKLFPQVKAGGDKSYFRSILDKGKALVSHTLAPSHVATPQIPKKTIHFLALVRENLDEIFVAGTFNNWSDYRPLPLKQVGRGRLFHAHIDVPIRNTVEYKYVYRQEYYRLKFEEGKDRSTFNGPVLDIIGNPSSSAFLIAMGDLVTHLDLERNELENCFEILLKSFTGRGPFSQPEIWAFIQLFSKNFEIFCFRILKIRRELLQHLNSELFLQIITHPNIPFENIQDFCINSRYINDLGVKLALIQKVFELIQTRTNHDSQSSYYHQNNYIHLISPLLDSLHENVVQLLSNEIPNSFTRSVFDKCERFLTHSTNQIIHSNNLPALIDYLFRKSAIQQLLTVFTSNFSFEFTTEELIPIVKLFLKNNPSLLPDLFITTSFKSKISEINLQLQGFEPEQIVKACCYLVTISPIFDDLILESIILLNSPPLTLFQMIEIPRHFLKIDWENSPNVVNYLLSLLPQVNSFNSLFEPAFNAAIRVFGNGFRCQIFSDFYEQWDELFNLIIVQEMKICDLIFVNSNLSKFTQLVPIVYSNRTGDLSGISELFRIFNNYYEILQSLSEISLNFGFSSEHEELSLIVSSITSSTQTLSELSIIQPARETVSKIISVLSVFEICNSDEISNLNNSDLAQLIPHFRALSSSILWSYFSQKEAESVVEPELSFSNHSDNEEEGEEQSIEISYDNIANRVYEFIQKLNPNIKISELTPWEHIKNSQDLDKELTCLDFILRIVENYDEIFDLLHYFIERSTIEEYRKCGSQFNENFPINFTGIMPNIDPSVNELSAMTLLELKSICEMFIQLRKNCRYCKTNLPSYLAILTTISKCSELLNILKQQPEDVDVDTIANLLIGSYSDFVAGDTTKNSFIDLLRDPRSLWNCLLKKSMKRPVSFGNFTRELHNWTHENNLDSSENVQIYCENLIKVNQASDRIQQLLRADGQIAVIIQLISDSNFAQGFVSFDFSTAEVSLSYPKENDEHVNIPPDSFRDARSEAILYQTNSQIHDSESSKILNNEGIKEFLNLCTYCSKAVETIILLKDYGYPIPDIISKYDVDVSQMQLFATSLEQLLKDWKYLLDEAQTFAEFAGMTGHEISDYLMGRRLSLLYEIFPLLEDLMVFSSFSITNIPVRNNGDSPEKRLGNVLERCQQAPSSSDRSISVHKVNNLSKVFYATIVLALEKRIQLSLVNTLLCTPTVEPSTVNVFLSRSVVENCIITAPEQLSYSSLEVLKKAVNNPTCRFNLTVVTCSDDVFRSLVGTSNQLFTDTHPSISTNNLAQIFRSNIPGQGKTTQARQLCLEHFVNLSGPVNIADFAATLAESSFIPEVPILFDINEPLDVLKLKFSSEYYTRSNFTQVDSDFYKLAVLLFSLLFISGVRFNGTSFILKSKICLEFPAIKPGSADWVSLLLSIILPDEVSQAATVNCSFDPAKFDVTKLTVCAADSRSFLNHLRTYTGNQETNYTDILSINFPDFPAPHVSLHSFRLLDAIISIASCQLNFFSDDRGIWTHVLEAGSAEYSQALSLVIAFSRQTALLSLRENSSEIISWSQAFQVHFVFASAVDHSFIVPPNNNSLPQALQTFIANNDHSRPVMPAQTVDRMRKIHSFYSESNFFPDLITQKFPDYALTEDCFRKQLIIVTRLLINLPTILMGASGVGKTYLLRHLVYTLFHPTELFYELCFNAGTPLQDLYDIIDEVNQAAKVLDSSMFPVLFLDEVNASDHLHLVTSLFTNRRINHYELNPRVRLVCAVNPFIKEEHQRLYNVHNNPWAFCNFIMDFGSLTDADERAYVREIATKFSFGNTSDTASNLLIRLHSLLKQGNTASWMVSLRDVQRCILIASKLQELMNNREFALWGHKYNRSRNPNTSLALAAYVCYVVRPHCRELRDRLLQVLDSEIGRGTKELVQESMIEFAEKIQRPDDIVLNTALVENIFSLFCGIISKTPIIIIGVPGQSKSLALTLLLSYMCKTTGRPSYLPQVHTTSYQGSRAATSESLLHVVKTVEEKAKKHEEEQKKANHHREEEGQKRNEVTQCLIMDELSLMKDAPANPLKALHSILEPKSRKPSFAFIGISNCEFDAAPSSRSIIVQRREHTANELTDTLSAICLGRRSHAKELVEIHKKLQKLATTFLQSNSSHSQSTSFYFYGNRDIYALAKFIAKSTASSLDHATHAPMFLRCYGGLPLSKNKSLMNDVQKQFHKVAKRDLTKGTVYQETLRLALAENLEDHSSTARHLLLIGSFSRALQLLNRSPRASELETLVGSRYEADSYREFNYHQLSRILTASATGKVIVLKNQENLIGALFDLLNRNYLRFDHKGVGICRVALGGTGNHLAHVNEKTRVVIVCSQEELLNQPPALLNRLEKINLNELANTTVGQADKEFWLELFEKFGLASIKCLSKDSLLYELSEVDNPLAVLWRFAVPSHVITLPPEEQTEISFYLDSPRLGFLTLSEVLEHYSSVPHGGAKRLVVFSNFFGDFFSQLSDYDNVVICSISQASCHEELVRLLIHQGEEASSSINSLLIIRLNNDEARHLTACCYIIQQNQLFESLDVVFTIINGTDCHVSLADGYDLYFADAIHLNSTLILDTTDALRFTYETIHSDHRCQLVSSLLVYSLMNSTNIPRNVLRISFHYLQSIYRNPRLLGEVSNILAELMSKPCIANALIFKSRAFPSFQDASDRYTSPSVQQRVFEYAQDAVVFRLTAVLSALSNSLLLLNTTMSTTDYWALCAELIERVVSSGLADVLSFKCSDIDSVFSCNIPFAPFILVCVKYLLSKNSATLFQDIESLGIFFVSLLADVFEGDSFVLLAKFVLNNCGFSSSVVNFFLTGHVLDCLTSVFTFIAESICDPSRKILLMANEYLASINQPTPMEDDVYKVIGVLVSLSGADTPAYRQLVSAILLHCRPAESVLDCVLLKWLRMLRVAEFKPEYFAPFAIVDLDTLINAIKQLFVQLNEDVTVVLSTIFSALPVDILFNFDLYQNVDTRPESFTNLTSIFYVVINNILSPASPLISHVEIHRFLSDIEQFFYQLALSNDQSLLPAISSALVSVFESRLVKPINFTFEELLNMATSIEEVDVVRTLVYSKLFVLKLQQSLLSREFLPASVLNLAFSTANDHLGFLRSSLFRVLLSQKTNAEALNTLVELINNCPDINSQDKLQLSGSLLYDESQVLAFINETDWASQPTMMSAMLEVQRSNNISLSPANVKALVSIKNRPVANLVPPTTAFLSSFDDCPTYLVPFAEFLTTNIAQQFSTVNLAAVFIPGSLSHPFISRFYVFSDPTNYVNPCTGCGAGLHVRDCGQFGHSNYAHQYGADTRCHECGNNQFTPSVQYRDFNQQLLRRYQSNMTAGPIPFAIDFVSEPHTALLRQFVIYNSLQNFIELLAIQYFGFLFACLAQPAVLNVFTTAFKSDSPVSYIRDFLSLLFRQLAPIYGVPLPQVPFIIGQKFRALDNFQGNFFATSAAEKAQNEQQIMAFLATLNNDPLPRRDQNSFNLVAKVTPQTVEHFATLQSTVEKVSMIATTVSEPTEPKLFEKFGAAVEYSLREAQMLMSFEVLELLPHILRLCAIARKFSANIPIKEWSEPLNNVLGNDESLRKLAIDGINAYNDLLGLLNHQLGNRQNGRVLLQFSCQEREFPKLTIRHSLSYFLIRNSNESIFLYELFSKIVNVHNYYSLNHLLVSDDVIMDIDLLSPSLHPQRFIDLGMLFVSQVTNPFAPINSQPSSLNSISHMLISTNLIRPGFILRDLPAPPAASDFRDFYLAKDGPLGSLFASPCSVALDLSCYIGLPTSAKLRLLSELSVILKTAENFNNEEIPSSSSLSFIDVISRGNIAGLQVLRVEDLPHLPLAFLLQFVEIIEDSFTLDELSNHCIMPTVELSRNEVRKLDILHKDAKRCALVLSRMKRFVVRYLAGDDVPSDAVISHWDFEEDTSLDFFKVNQIIDVIRRLLKK
ncbi:hypothetical protein RCL1_001347 [Eukaryota sp. TZLM3-RCL]